MNFKTTQSVTLNYTNWQNETEARHIVPIKLWYGKTEYHKEDQWLLKCWDLDKSAERDYAMKDIHSWQAKEPS